MPWEPSQLDPVQPELWSREEEPSVPAPVRPLGGVIGFEYEERKGDPMSRCSTWHVRIDLVDDGTRVTARAKLIGAPASMTQSHDSGPHDGCLTGGTSSDLLAAWQPLADLAPMLADSLSSEHCAHSL